MSKYTKFFNCKVCKGESFIKAHSFGMDFQEVNFSDDLIYSKHEIELYKCLDCGEAYKPEEIANEIKELIRKYKSDYWEREIG